MELIGKLKECGVINFGNFKLKGGADSNVYIDFRQLINFPKILKEVAYRLGALVEDKNGITVGGVPLGGVPYAAAISYIYDIPSILIRTTRKTHGSRKLVEGDHNKPVVLIEDVVTTGKSILEAIAILEEENIKIAKILVILDRECEGISILRQKYNVGVLLKLSDILHIPLEWGIPTPRNLRMNKQISKFISIVKKRESNLVVAVDLTDPAQAINLIQRIYPHICAIKIHLDIFPLRFHQKFIGDLRQLKKMTPDLFIIEDRKFSDVPKICGMQYENLPLDLIDAVTVHGIMGLDLLEFLDTYDMGIIVVHQLSLENHFIDSITANKIRDASLKLNNFLGFVSQNPVSPDTLTFVPGVNVSSTHENGQLYSPPNSRGDIFIVGKGIYESPDPEQAAILYKNLSKPQKN